jgi:hypothetical protein
MILRNISTFLRVFTKFINDQPKWFRGFLLPVVIPLSAVVFLQLADFENHPVRSYLLVSTYAMFLALNAIALYQNSVLVEESKKQDRHKERLIHHIDLIVSRRRQDLVGTIRRHHQSKPVILARSIRSKFDFESSVSRINKELLNTIIEYLHSSGRLGTSNLHMSLISPNEKERFCRIGGQEKTTGNTRAMPVDTGISLKDEDSLTVQLWFDHSSIIRSVPDTEKAESDGCFKFVTQSERGLIRSLLCFRIDHPVTDKPFAVWRIDASDENVFPSEEDTKTIKDLSKILSCFSERLTLEIVYDTLFRHLTDIFEDDKYEAKRTKD